jgi:ATP-binding cassette subfamily B protein
VAPGKTHHVDGPSGFGKTTLLKIIAGFYQPHRGAVSIGGRTPQEASEFIAYLPQRVKLFNTDIYENLRLFSGGATHSRLIEAAGITGLAEFVDELAMGYDTLLACGGENFSGGQRQMIALTAILASDKPILLLDEAMANLDAARQSQLVASGLFDGRTVIYTSHDACKLSCRGLLG